MTMFNEFARNQLLIVVDKIKQMVADEEAEKGDFEAVVRPVLKYLCENYHPHVTLIITPTRAELLEILDSTSEILDYIVD